MIKHLSYALFTLSVLLPARLTAGGSLHELDNGLPKGAQLTKIVQDTPLQELQGLRERLGAFPQIQTLSSLRPLLSEFEAFHPSGEALPLDVYASRFTNYVKVLDLLVALGDVDASATYRTLYATIQEAVGDAIGDDEDDIISVALYRFYYECFALLNPQISLDIAQRYREGMYPFPKVQSRAAMYETGFSLTLAPSLLNTGH